LSERPRETKRLGEEKHMSKVIVGLGLACGTIVVALACTGKTADVSGDGGGSSGTSGTSGTSGGSSGGLVPACPTAAPAASSACTSPQLQCEYGTDTNPRCNTLATCEANGTWTITAPQGTCPTPPPGPSCPATYGAVTQGATCPVATSCAYPEGTCACEINCGPQYPLPRPCDAGTPLTWVCGGASAGCPAIRPHAGTACSQDQQLCTYGDCTAPAVRCQNGSWHESPQSCPISTRTKKQDIHYLSTEDVDALAHRTLATRLATYEYISGDPSPHLGFIIEDDPDSPAVLRDKGHVDLYAYTSMAVATLQAQSREIAALRREVEALKRAREAEPAPTAGRR
jgi:hypothetical protein